MGEAQPGILKIEALCLAVGEHAFEEPAPTIMSQLSVRPRSFAWADDDGERGYRSSRFTYVTTPIPLPSRISHYSYKFVVENHM